jgi:hypothetical protein
MVSRINLIIGFIFGLSSISLYFWWDLNKQIEHTTPIFVGSERNIIYAVKYPFGISSLEISDGKTKRRLAIHFGEITGLLSDKKLGVYYLLNKRFDSLIYHLNILGTKKSEQVFNGKDIGLMMGSMFSEEEILVSYRKWVDTKTLFVGYTCGDAHLGILNTKTKDIRVLQIEDSDFEYPRLISGTQQILFKHFPGFGQFDYFKVYNLTSKIESFLSLKKEVENWDYDVNSNHIYFVSGKFVWKYTIKNNTLERLFELKGKIDFLVKHPKEMLFLIRFSASPNDLIFLDETGKEVDRVSV